MLVLHPRIYLSANADQTDALLIRDGYVLAHGDKARALSRADDPVYAPEGTCIFPALWDAHIHLWGAGLRADTLDLRELTVQEIRARLQDAAPGKSGWILGINVDEHHFAPPEVLDRDLLDQLLPHTPACLRRVDGHALWTNSTGLKLSSIDPAFVDPPGGAAHRDETGRLTGYLVDAAMHPLIEAIPAPGLAENQAVFLSTARILRSHGITAASMAWCSVEELEILRNLDRNERLPIFVDVWVDGLDPALNDLLTSPYESKNLRIHTVKFFADGALGSAGAHLLDEYRGGQKGLATHRPGFLQRRIPELMNAGWQIAVHAIGDAAAREVLDAFAEVPPEIRQQLRPRLEHAQIVHPDDARRLAELNVIASIQPSHLRSDATWAHQRLHEPQLPRLFPWRSYIDADFAAGSDYPIEDPNPWHGIATALTRIDSRGTPFHTEHCLTRQEILHAYTMGAAFAAHQEDTMGTLYRGHRGHLLVLDTDPFRASPEEIWHTEVLELLATDLTSPDAGI